MRAKCVTFPLALPPHSGTGEYSGSKGDGRCATVKKHNKRADAEKRGTMSTGEVIDKMLLSKNTNWELEHYNTIYIPTTKKQPQRKIRKSKGIDKT